MNNASVILRFTVGTTYDSAMVKCGLVSLGVVTGNDLYRIFLRYTGPCMVLKVLVEELALGLGRAHTRVNIEFNYNCTPRF